MARRNDRERYAMRQRRTAQVAAGDTRDPARAKRTESVRAARRRYWRYRGGQSVRVVLSTLWRRIGSSVRTFVTENVRNVSRLTYTCFFSPPSCVNVKVEKIKRCAHFSDRRFEWAILIQADPTVRLTGETSTARVSRTIPFHSQLSSALAVGARITRHVHVRSWTQQNRRETPDTDRYVITKKKTNNEIIPPGKTWRIRYVLCTYVIGLRLCYELDEVVYLTQKCLPNGVLHDRGRRALDIRVSLWPQALMLYDLFNSTSMIPGSM